MDEESRDPDVPEDTTPDEASDDNGHGSDAEEDEQFGKLFRAFENGDQGAEDVIAVHLLPRIHRISLSLPSGKRPGIDHESVAQDVSVSFFSHVRSGKFVYHSDGQMMSFLRQAVTWAHSERGYLPHAGRGEALETEPEFSTTPLDLLIQEEKEQAIVRAVARLRELAFKIDPHFWRAFEAVSLKYPRTRGVRAEVYFADPVLQQYKSTFEKFETWYLRCRDDLRGGMEGEEFSE